MDQTRLKWVKVDQIGLNGPKWIKLDKNGLKWMEMLVDAAQQDRDNNKC